MTRFKYHLAMGLIPTATGLFGGRRDLPPGLRSLACSLPGTSKTISVAAPDYSSRKVRKPGGRNTCHVPYLPAHCPVSGGGAEIGGFGKGPVALLRVTSSNKSDGTM